MAEVLNMWMRSDNDDIFYELFEGWTGSIAHSPLFFEFFMTIKREFPETIFHGIDVADWQYPAGRRFLQYLGDNNKQETEQYLLTLESIEQGEQHYQSNFNQEFRVTKMAENFIRTFDGLAGQNVMGIFGSAHTAFGFYGVLGHPDTPTMAERLRVRYGDSVHTEDLTWLALEGLPWFGLEINPMPISVDIITVNGLDYEASYFGTDLTEFRGVVSRSFWRLENAFNDFRNKPTNGDMLPFENYPMMIEINQIFIVDMTFTNGSVLRLFYRSDGHYWLGRPITIGFNVD